MAWPGTCPSAERQSEIARNGEPSTHEATEDVFGTGAERNYCLDLGRRTRTEGAGDLDCGASLTALTECDRVRAMCLSLVKLVAKTRVADAQLRRRRHGACASRMTQTPPPATTIRVRSPNRTRTRTRTRTRIVPAQPKPTLAANGCSRSRSPSHLATPAP